MQVNLGEARDQYVEHFLKIITPSVYDGFVGIYITAVQESKGQNKLQHFQRLLKDIKLWNSIQIDTALNKITSQNSWLKELITAIVVCSVKILSSVKLSDVEDKKISLKVPKESDVIHKIYIKCARNFFEDPYVFQNYNSNKDEIIDRIHNCTLYVIRELLPLENILKTYIDINNNSPVDVINSGTPQEEEDFESQLPEPEETEEPEEPEEAEEPEETEEPDETKEIDTDEVKESRAEQGTPPEDTDEPEKKEDPSFF